MANGHPSAPLYPLGMVADEAALIIERENRRVAGEAIAFKAAATAVMAPKEGGPLFTELVDELMGE